MSSNHKFSVLDKGSVELLGMFGDELTIVNAARVSFGSAKSELDKKDIRLIKYLYKHKHMSPFRHLMFRFRIKAPGPGICHETILQTRDWMRNYFQ